MNQHKVIVSLYDKTGNWSRPYKKAGYEVIRHDLQLGQDIFTDTIPAAISDYVEGRKIHGLLAAIPCTDFAVSGARWFGQKEAQPADYKGPVEFFNTVDMSIGMALAVLFIVELLSPSWWCAEQPISRLHNLVPEMGKPKIYFNPYEFGHPYSKKTALYGNFNTNIPRTPVLNLFGSEMWSKYGGNSLKTKNKRSETPSGFAQAFFEANP